VAASEGSWGACDLVIDSELGPRLTNHRFVNLVRYCGDVKHLEVRDARSLSSAVFGCFSARLFLAKSFASLETVKLTNCSGLTSSGVLACMKDTGMFDRPKEDRFRCLRLAGCNMQEKQHLAELQECLGTGQREVFFERRTRNGQENVLVRKPYTMAASIIDKSSVDLWPCHACHGSASEDVFFDCIATTAEEVAVCESCLKTFCGARADHCGTRYCDTYFVCNDSDCEESVHVRTHDDCDKTFCEDCGHDPDNLRMCTDGKKEWYTSYRAD
jgi:hypothetical protein